jgi:DNA-binding Xre family transcriptional regulator
MAIEWRFDVLLIDSATLARYMKFRDESVRSLAKKVGCSPATIGHLRSGQRRIVRDEWAKQIEVELNAPPGSLFSARLSRVSRDTAREAVPA